MGLLIEASLFAVGLVYPVHLSLNAIASGSRDDSLHVLCFWMLHAVLLSAEELLEGVVALCVPSEHFGGEALAP
jgi:hypothetical protein